MAVRTLVTGGAGFIGSHLCEALIAAGDEVVALDNLSTGSRENLAALQEQAGNRFRLEHADILDAAAVDRAVADADRVFHLAAAVGVRLVMERPVSTIVTNTRGTEHVLDACARHKRRVLLASSSEVYGKMGSMQDAPLRESDDWRLGATTTRRWSYACTKALDEFLAFAHAKESGLGVVVVRLFNTVGPRQSPHYGMVIPAFIDAARSGRELIVHGDGTQTRCFNSVHDAVDALVRLMVCADATNEVVNVGSDRPVSIGDLAALVIRACKSASTVRLLPYAQVYGGGFEDMARRTPSLEKLRSLIGGARTRPIEEIVAEMITATGGSMDDSMRSQ